MNKTPDIAAEFKAVYGFRPDAAASAPGRVNLIGEHTDYNRGFVLPMGVERRVWAAGALTDDNSIEVSSAEMTEPAKLIGLIRRTGIWADYPIGVIWALRENGHSVPGVKIHFHGNVPLGGGLSSSAAIEVAAAMLVVKLAGLNLSRKEIASLCQLAENQFVGMKCGAMDQMASALAREGKALYIDCGDLSYTEVPFAIGDYNIVIIDSGVKRELAHSAYNKRRNECEEAAASLGVKSLREVNIKDLDKVEKLPDPLNRRARHVITENDRVQKAVEFLSKADLEQFGKLMTASHASLRDDYEVSIPALDFLVEECNRLEGVLGARLTGAGFGGCIVALAHKDVIPQIDNNVLQVYKSKFDKEPTLMITHPAEGARMETF